MNASINQWKQMQADSSSCLLKKQNPYENSRTKQEIRNIIDPIGQSVNIWIKNSPGFTTYSG